MNKKIIIFTVLITNITFAYALPVEVREVSTSESRKNTHTVAGMSVEKLHERGLNKDAAQNKVANSLQHDEQTIHIMAQNIVNHLDEVKHHDIVSHICDAALFGKRVDLSSYEHLISFVQKTKKAPLTQETLEKLHKISLENQAIA